jgi:hypothetical protein
MIVPIIGRRLSRPAGNNIMPVPFVESGPVLSLPGIVERLHQF